MRSRKLRSLQRWIPMAMACVCCSLLAIEPGKNAVRDDGEVLRAPSDLPESLWDAQGLRVVRETAKFLSQQPSDFDHDPSRPAANSASEMPGHPESPIDHLEYRASITIRRGSVERITRVEHDPQPEPTCQLAPDEYASIPIAEPQRKRLFSRLR